MAILILAPATLDPATPTWDLVPDGWVALPGLSGWYPDSYKWEGT